MPGDPSFSKDSIADAATDFKDTATSTAKQYGDAAASAAQSYGDAAAGTAKDIASKASAATQSIQNNVASVASDLKDRASQHADQAKTIVSSIADEARGKISDIVEHQKSAGAERLSGVARAAQTAANDLDEQNPQVARLVRDAAASVDRFAGDLRSSNVTDIVASVSNFARQQPVAFFAGSVLAGFALARFLKSEPAPARSYYPSDQD